MKQISLAGRGRIGGGLHLPNLVIELWKGGLELGVDAIDAQRVLSPTRDLRENRSQLRRATAEHAAHGVGRSKGRREHWQWYHRSAVACPGEHEVVRLRARS